MDEMKKFIANADLTVSEAMQKIDAGAAGILFLTDDRDILVGCITDGDIRRFLLGGGTMKDPALKACNKNPRVAHSHEEAKRLYHDRDYIAIPILDDQGSINALYKGNNCEIRKKNRLNTPVVINAGGKGTRLDPFTRVLPKPLIPVGEFPIVELIMREYQSYGCDQFHMIVNYKKNLMKAYFAENENRYDITWHDEEKPLGTGGGLSLLRGKLTDTFFFANCDALLTANYESMLKFHKENENKITMICAYKNFNIPYGVVRMGKNGVIEKMEEKPLLSYLVNTGIYIVEPEVIDDIEDNVAIGFPDIIEKERQRGKKVAAFPVSENDWMDMGQLPELEKMRRKLYGE